MGIMDILLMVLIAAGALYLLYHSIWKKKGHCIGSGCCSGSAACSPKQSSECHSDTAEKDGAA